MSPSDLNRFSSADDLNSTDIVYIVYCFVTYSGYFSDISVCFSKREMRYKSLCITSRICKKGAFSANPYLRGT